MTTGRINQVTVLSTIRRQSCVHTELSQKPKLPKSQQFVTHISYPPQADLKTPVTRCPAAGPQQVLITETRSVAPVARCLLACLKVMTYRNLLRSSRYQKPHHQSQLDLPVFSIPLKAHPVHPPHTILAQRRDQITPLAESTKPLCACNRSHHAAQTHTRTTDALTYFKLKAIPTEGNTRPQPATLA